MPERDEARRSKTDGPVENAKPVFSTASPTSDQRTATRRQRPVPKLYRLLIHEIRQQLDHLGWSLARADDVSGLNDGHTAHLLSPDSPTGKVGTFHTMDLLVAAAFYFGNYEIKILPAPPLVSVPTNGEKAALPNHAKQVAHWRVPQFFRELGARGGTATAQRHGKQLAKKRGRRGARIRWQRHRERQKKNAGAKS